MELGSVFDDMSNKLLFVVDPDNPYTQEDFDNEFKGVGTSTISVNKDLYKLNFNFVNKSNNPDPEYATIGSSGFDIRADLNEPMTIMSGEYKLVKTGLYFDIPDNMEITIRSRSGLAYKYGVSVLNGIGTIDSDYVGEIGVLLINHGKENFIINNGDRIAQAVLTSVIGKNLVNFNKVSEISDNTSRSTGGYGSTGIR